MRLLFLFCALGQGCQTDATVDAAVCSPRWATIVVLTLAIRMAIFPLVKSGLQSSARMAKFMPEMKQYQTAIEAAQDQPTKMQLSMALQKAMKREKISMLGPLKQPLISIPVFLGMFWGIESMCKLPVWQFKVQGIPDWCTDLTVADPLFILPITSGIATWCIIHVRFSPSSLDCRFFRPDLLLDLVPCSTERPARPLRQRPTTWAT